MRFELVFLCIMSLNLVYITQAQNTPTDFLNAHTPPRTQVGVTSLVWDTTVATYAQNYANQQSATCNMVHSGGPYGENLAWSSSDLNATSAVNLWVAEKQYYTYSTNTCASGKVCGHYTQVVWSNSIRLGCGRIRCSNGATLIICNYDPPGNYVGELPY